MEPFAIEVAPAIIADLQARLARTRLPDPTPAPAWGAGTDLGYLAALIRYWRDGFDWPARAAWLNSFPQFTARIDGQLVHFVHVRAARRPGGPAPVPLVLSHGWPYSFVELLPLVPFLTDPAAHGGRTEDLFDVVIPSLPGFGFSEPLKDQPFTDSGVARLWHLLMTRELGYERYGTYGEDVGAGISDRIAALYPESVLGLFATHAAFPPPERRQHLSRDEQAFVDWLAAKWAAERGYSTLQGTKPDTLAVGLTDSPAGLAAWLVEKFRGWSGCEGEIERVWSKDEILTTVMLYWITGSIGTSFRPYFDGRADLPLPLVNVPVGVSVQHGERGFPRSYAARTYTDIRAWNQLPSGGHFTAKESPFLVAEDMRGFFRALR